VRRRQHARAGHHFSVTTETLTSLIDGNVGSDPKALTTVGWEPNPKDGSTTPGTRPDQPDPPFDGRSTTVLDRTFKVSVSLKGVDGALEIIGGIALLFVAPATLQQWARTLTAHELAQDPNDFIAHHVLHSASQLSHSTTLFGAIYLLSHGLAKVVLVVAVLREQLWAYPWMIALLGVFIAYQLYRLTYRLTVGLTLLTVFDAFVVWLTWREYRIKRRRRTPV
jgi:uncharacterized membrane protein